jgi:hypothetical protein
MHNRLFACCLISAALVGCGTTPPATASGRNPVQRDVEGYAVASCLAYQKQAYLKDQGDGWASVIIQRSKGELEAFTAVADAVKTEVAKGNMVVIPVETGPEHEKALPVAYCFEILNAPSVHAAVKHAVEKLSTSYEQE